MSGLLDELSAYSDLEALMHRVAEQTCVLLPDADGAAISLLDHDGCLVVLAASGAVTPQAGRVVPVDRTFSAEALRSGRPERSDDIAIDDDLTPEVRMVGTRLGVRSCVNVPLRRGASSIGVLSVVARRPCAFDDEVLKFLASLSDFVSATISANIELDRLLPGLFGPPATGRDPVRTARFVASLVVPEMAERDRIRNEIDELECRAALTAVFQPIVSLRGRHRVHGFEGLCRFPDARSPERWFRSAHQVGRGVQLELAALRTVLDAAEHLPVDYPLGVNLSPIASLHPRAKALLLAADRELVLELTEHEPAPDPLCIGLAPLRDAGIRLAVDDAGAGFAGLTQIVRLHPDILKIDRELTAGVETDRVRRAVIMALVTFAAELGAVTVAEGVESDDQCRALRDLGVDLGQGYRLGAPTTADDLLRVLAAENGDRPR